MNSLTARLQRQALAVLATAALVAGCLLASACSTSKQIVLPVSGIDSHVSIIDCSGASLTWSHCYRKAGETCPLGYKILENSYKHGDRVVTGDVLQLAGNSAQHRRMLIDCKAPGKPDSSAVPSDSAIPADTEPDDE